MKVPARPIDEWPYNVLCARLRLVLADLDPDSVSLRKIQLRRLRWREAVELSKEIDRRGLQGRLWSEPQRRSR